MNRRAENRGRWICVDSVRPSLSNTAVMLGLIARLCLLLEVDVCVEVLFGDEVAQLFLNGCSNASC